MSVLRSSGAWTRILVEDQLLENRHLSPVCMRCRTVVAYGVAEPE